MADALSVIPLTEAKDYLKVDLDYTYHDELIKSNIRTAVALVEQHTNHMLYVRNKSYNTNSTSYEVYDYPFRVISLTDAYNTALVHEVETHTLHSKIKTSYKLPAILTAEVGYAARAVTPEPLIAAALKLVAFLYDHRDIARAEIPNDVQLMLQPYKRYASI